ncbi:MAG: choice-of-anchor Q domain-containing protein [Thermomicrobiales bacterium]
MVTPQNERTREARSMEIVNDRRLRWICTCFSAGALFVALAFTVPLTVRAGTRTVTNCLDDGSAGTLRAQIAAAVSGDTINFNLDCPSGGPITLNSGSGTLTIAVNLNIDGTGHTIVIDGGCVVGGGGQCAIYNGVTVFTINSGMMARLNTLTIQHGTSASGSSGGISNSGTLTVTNDTLAFNAANSGGGGISNSGTLTVINSTFSGNFTSGPGGGISNGGSLSVTNSTFSSNTALLGGGIYNSASPATVTNSTFSANVGNGGGINNDVGGTITVTNCTFTLNAAALGPGMSTENGGAIHVAGGTLTLTNSTLSGNTATASGGGCACGPGATLTNNIVAGNSASSSGPDVSGGPTSVGHNLIGKTDGSSGWIASDLTGTVASPLNPLLDAAVANNGGPTQTYALLPGSPAINAGDDTICTQTGTGKVGNLDQRGISRTGFGAHCDIGAFESRGFMLTISGGSNQSATTGTAFANPLAVTVSSTNSEPVQNGRVTFTANPAGGASAALTGSPATIGGGGAASVTAMANGTPGGNTVTASATGAASVTFNLTNTPNLVTISPSSGGMAGGNHVILTGVGFGTAANTQVLSNGIAIPAANLTSVTVTVTVNGTALSGSVTYQYGVVNPLPGRQPVTGSGNPDPLPLPRPSAPPQGNPRPLPTPRP